jgi:hypothetical protein
MARKRLLTEMIGCTLPKSEYEMIKAEMKKRKLTVSEYLRQTSVAPLIHELTHQEVHDALDSGAVLD